MKKNYVFAILTVFIWATMAAVVKLLLADIPNLQALSVSSVFAFVFLLLMNIKTGAVRQMRTYAAKDYLIMAGLGFLGLFLYTALYYYGIAELGPQTACILNYLWPIMLVIFSAVILKEKLTWVKWVAMLCSFLGIIILSAGNDGASTGNAWLGMIGCIVAAACYGLFSVLNIKTNYNPNIAMMVMWLTVAVCSAALGLFTETWVPVKDVQWVGLIWLGVVVDAVAYLLWALALKGTDSTAKIANLAYLTPFLSLVVSAVVFPEDGIQPRAVIALVFIVGGILFQSFFESLRKKRSAHSDSLTNEAQQNEKP